MFKLTGQFRGSGFLTWSLSSTKYIEAFSLSTNLLRASQRNLSLQSSIGKYLKVLASNTEVNGENFENYERSMPRSCATMDLKCHLNYHNRI